MIDHSKKQIAPVTGGLILPLTILFVGLLFGCENKISHDLSGLNLKPRGRDVPNFNADTAYQFVERQVAFGPRNPNSEGHQQTLHYLSSKLEMFAGSAMVFQQNFTHVGYRGDTLQLTNIVASFNPKASDRIMLCAHWDTRPRAEEAQNPAQKDDPILGADDGASGVGVILELARVMKAKPPPVGVDIILFDGEDYGKRDSLQHYFLGSRYWSENPPVPNYKPRFAILLDMVGGQNARFPKERYSLNYAEPLVNEIWAIADTLGYNRLFLSQTGRAIQDDHVIINREARIPAVDIINHSMDAESSKNGFPEYWHTPRDNMDIIDKNTLDAVGEVLTELIYNRL